MSRHEFVDDKGATWTVGWDEPMVSYFAQRELEDGELEDIAGTSIGEVTTLDGLLERLRDRVELPDEIHAKLQRDQPEFTAPAIAAAHERHASLAEALSGAAATQPPAQQPEVER